MLFRSLVTAVAAMGLAASVFAGDETNSPTQNQNSTTDAQQVAQADTTATTTSTTTTVTTDVQQTKVDLNKSTAKELSKVKGLNSAKAKAIVAYRKKHGDFKSLDELKDVRGFKKMNDETFKQIQDQLSLS